MTHASGPAEEEHRKREHTTRGLVFTQSIQQLRRCCTDDLERDRYDGEELPRP